MKEKTDPGKKGHKKKTKQNEIHKNANSRWPELNLSSLGISGSMRTAAGNRQGPLIRAVKTAGKAGTLRPGPGSADLAYTSLASSRIWVLLAKSLEMGQPPLAPAAALSKTS